MTNAKQGNMSLDYVDEQPQQLRYFPADDDIASRMSEADVASVVEIFNTPLTGAYNWDYSLPDSRIRRLYELGKQLNWNVEVDLDWEQKFSRDQLAYVEELNPYSGFDPYDKLSDKDKVDISWHRQSIMASGFLHGEQGALLVASQLTSCAPSYDAKLYAASQTFDEARHVEFFNKYIQKRIGIMYPCGANLKALLDKVLTDPRWDLKFIGMQIIIEGLALAAFNTTKKQARDPLLKQGIHYVIRDEARHVTFGVNYLEEYIKTLTTSEVEERAQFALEALMGILGRGRANPLPLYKKYGWNADEVREHLSGKQAIGQIFGEQLFGRILPNLKRIGLLTDSVKQQFDNFGILHFADLPNDGDISWSEMSKPLVYQETADSEVNAIA